MIRGILALFRSGIIFDPFVLFGVLSGLVFAMSPNKEMVEQILSQNSFYLLILLLGALYNFFVKRVYKDDGDTVDYLRVGWNTLMSLVKYVLSCAFAMMFVLMVFSF